MIKWFWEKILNNLLLLVVIVMIMVWQRASDFDEKSFLNRLDFLFYDLKLKISQQFFYSQEAMENVVIVDIDEASLKQEGRWPWSRSRIADLVSNLQDYGALVIAFDMVFSEPERGEFVSRLEKNGDINQSQAKTLEAILENWAPDKRFSEIISQSDIVLGYILDQKRTDKNGALNHKLVKLPPNNVLIPGVGYTTSIEEIQQGAASEGFITTFFDEDGVSRRTPLIMKVGDYAYPSLSLSAVMSYMLVDKIEIKFDKLGDFEIVTEIKVTEKPVNTDALGRVLIPYKGNKNYVKYIPAKDVFNQTADEADLAGKIVFVGTSAIGLSDLIHTPFGSSFPGVEVHAIVAENLLKVSFPYRPVWSPSAVLITQIFLSLILTLLIRNQKPTLMVLISLFVLCLIIGGNLWIWKEMKLEFPIVSTLVLTLFIFFWFLVSGFIREFQQEMRIKGMFAQYLPPAHIDQMLNNPENYSMDGESKILTVLFADIRGFTTLSESLTATELKRFLNEYLTPITEVIFRHGGTIDKYVGDMVMAFWGAPLEDPKHRENAVIAALEMQKLIETLSKEFMSQGLPEVKMGIGLNTGMMNVGDMGSQYRKAYTVLGDAVNLGSRLESLTKYYGITVLIGEDTKGDNEEVVFRFCDKIKVKGKNEAINAYEPIDLKENIDPKTLENLNLYHQCIEHYQKMQWNEALEGLEKLKQREPNRKLYDIYIHRISGLKEVNLPPDWDGVFVHNTK